jgi:dynein heavy chain
MALINPHSRPITQAQDLYRYCPPCVNFMNGKFSEALTGPPLETIIPVTAISQVRQLCAMLEAILSNDEVKDAEVLESIFIFGAIWSFGGALGDDSILELSTSL